MAAEEVARKVAASAAVLEQLHARRAAQSQLVKELTTKVHKHSRTHTFMCGLNVHIICE